MSPGHLPFTVQGGARREGTVVLSDDPADIALFTEAVADLRAHGPNERSALILAALRSGPPDRPAPRSLESVRVALGLPIPEPQAIGGGGK